MFIKPHAHSEWCLFNIFSIIGPDGASPDNAFNHSLKRPGLAWLLALKGLLDCVQLPSRLNALGGFNKCEVNCFTMRVTCTCDTVQPSGKMECYRKRSDSMGTHITRKMLWHDFASAIYFMLQISSALQIQTTIQPFFSCKQGTMPP